MNSINNYILYTFKYIYSVYLMDPNIQNRYLDIYSNILQNTLVNYNQTNDTIRQVESGVRQLIRHNHGSGLLYNDSNMNPIRSNEYSRTNVNNSINQGLAQEGYLFREPYVSQFYSHRNRPISNNRMRHSQGTSTRQSTRNYNRSTTRQTSVPSVPSVTSVPSVPSVPDIQTNRRTDLTFDHLPSLLTRFFTNSINQPNQPNLDNLTPVIVRPTPEQINIATEDISWNVDIGSDMCPITQEPFNSYDIVSRIHQCGHCFSQDGLRQWFTLSVYCPVCRYDIRDYTDSTNENQHEGSGNGDSGNGDSGNGSEDNESVNEEANINNISNNNTRNTNIFNNDLLRSITTQLTQSLNQNMNAPTNTNDISNNSTGSRTGNNRGEITFEYFVQTPDNVYSSTPLSTDNLSNLFHNRFLGNNR